MILVRLWKKMIHENASKRRSNYILRRNGWIIQLTLKALSILNYIFAEIRAQRSSTRFSREIHIL